MSANQGDVDAPGDQRFERGIGRRLAEAEETPVLQVRDPWRELEPEQGAEGEDMVGIAAAIGMVATGHDLALVIEQPVEDMRGFAGGRRDHLGVERCVAVGDVRVELDPGFITVMGIGAARVAPKAAGPEELAIRGTARAIFAAAGEAVADEKGLA